MAIWPRLLVMPGHLRLVGLGCDRRGHLPRAVLFFTVVVSPFSDLTLTSSILSVSSPAKTFSCLLAASPPSGCFHGDEIDIRAEAGEHENKRNRRFQPAHCLLSTND